MSNRNLSACDRVQEKALYLDLYRRPFMFNLPDEAAMYRSFFGSVLSLITITALLSYAVYKLINLESRKDFKINEAHQE